MRDLVTPWFWKFVTLALLLAVAWISFMPVTEAQPPLPHFDKTVHWCMYFLLAGWCLQIVRVGEIPTTLLFLFGYSVAIEFGQTFVPLRSAETLDILANGIGLASAYWIQRYRSHRSVIEKWFRARPTSVVPPSLTEKKETLG